jgi:AraC-like DNA-binding protein
MTIVRQMSEAGLATFPRGAVEYVQRVLADVGVRVDGIAEGFGERVPAAAVYRLWDAAEREAADPAIGLRAAALLRAEDFGLLGALFEQTPTLGEGLVEISRLVSPASAGIGWVLVVKGERTTFELVADEPTLLHPRAAEHIVAMLAFAVQSRLPAGESCGLTAHWAHPCPRPGTGYGGELGMGVRFDAGWNGVSFATEALRTPGLVVAADLDETRRRADSLRDHRPPLETHVRELIVAELGTGRPVTGVAVARQVGLHPKALARRLAAQGGTTFRRLVEAERLDRSRRLLQAGRSVDAVARAVGYADVTTFSRAFKRWTGSTPAAYAARTRARRGTPPSAPAG